jgi:hypothetical protein
VLENFRDLIDVLAHGFRRAVGIAPAQRCNDGFVSHEGSKWATLLFQRALARFHEQIVQGGHDAEDHAIARRARENLVKGRILSDGRSAGLELPALRVEDAL